MVDAELLPNDVLRRAGHLAGQLAVRENRLAILSKQGKRSELPRPTQRYKRRKDKMARGKLPKGSPRRTQYAAKEGDDRGRLSGRLVSDIAYKGVKVQKGANELDIYVDIVIKGERSNRIYGYLQELEFDMIGLASPGTALGKMQRRRILAGVKEFLKLNARARGVLLEDTL